MYILLISSTLNIKLFGDENKANDHIYSNLSKMKNEILPTALQGNYSDHLGEFRNKSYDVFGAERVKKAQHI